MSKRNSLEHAVMMYGSAPFNEDFPRKEVVPIIPDFYEKKEMVDDDNQQKLYNKLVMGVLATLPSYTLMRKVDDHSQKTAAEMINLIKTNQLEGMMFVMDCMAKGLSF